MKHELVAFDVNETLLDVSALAPVLADAVGSEVTLGEWFARLLHRSLLANQLDQHSSFGELGVEALVWLAARANVKLDREHAGAVVATMAELPPHPDVLDGVKTAAATGVRMIALTNGSQTVAEQQVANAGLDRFFERVLSVDSVGRFKPAPEVYRHAAEVCAVDIGAMVLVAAHDWDVVGAQEAGAVGCFVHRQPWGLSGADPDLEIDDLGGLAAALEA